MPQCSPILWYISKPHYSNPDPISDLSDCITPAFLQYPEPQHLYHTHNESLALRAVYIKTKWSLSLSVPFIFLIIYNRMLGSISVVNLLPQSMQRWQFPSVERVGAFVSQSLPLNIFTQK
jgi:hypothetical protein